MGTLKKDRSGVFSEYYPEIFETKFLRYVNEVLFEMVKKALKDTYLGGTTPTTLQNEVSTCWKMYDDSETRIMVNQSVNEFYTQFFFKIDALPQDVAFSLEISATFFNNLSPDVRELLISEGVQVPPIPQTENNHKGNQRLLLVRNTAMESEKKIRTIKAAAQTASGSRHLRTFMIMLAGNASTQMSCLVSNFQYEESKSMAVEEMEEYALSYAEASYEDLG